MPRNGTGAYNLPGGINPVVPNTVISSNWANTTLADIASALTGSVAADGQTAMTGSLNMGTHRIRGVADPVESTDAVNLDYLMSKGLDRIGVSGWERPESGTFPPITEVAPTTVHVPEGRGFIINPETGTTDVVWEAADVVLANTATWWATTIGIDVSGNIVQLEGNVDESLARSYVILGVVAHPMGSITSILNAPNILGNVAYGMYDLAMLSRNEVISGGTIFGNALDPLSFDLDARRIFYYGGSPNIPSAVNFVDQPAVTGVRFFPITGSGGISASTFDVPVTMYDPDGLGVITAIPGDSEASTVFRLYEMAGTFFLLYGQAVYPSLETAVTNIWAEKIVLPENLSNATLTGVIVTKRSTTDLKDPTTTQMVSTPGSGGGGTNVSLEGYVYRVEYVDVNTVLDRSFRNTLIVVNQPITVVLTIRANTGDEALDWRDGDGPFMVLQGGAGKVQVVVEGSDTLLVASGYLAETRTAGSMISGSCFDAANGKWAMGGDLLQSADDPTKMVMFMDDRVALAGTNIAVGTLRSSRMMPFDFQLDPIDQKGLYATLMVAQAAGSLVTVDVNVNGVSILATRLTFDLNEKTTVTAATPAVYSEAFLAANRIIPADAEVTYDVDVIGTALAKGLTLVMKGQRAS